MRQIGTIGVREIGTIGNYYGSLWVQEDSGRFYWGIENYTGTHWEEIPESLYRALMAFEDARLEKGNKFQDSL